MMDHEERNGAGQLAACISSNPRPRAGLAPWIAGLLSLATAGCDTSTTTPPDDEDAGVSADGGGGADAGPAPADAAAPDAAPGADGGGLPTSCLGPADFDPAGTDALEDATGRATVTVDDRAACQRTYTLTTTAPLRHGLPDNPRTVEERAGAPTLRSGHDLFDALYALALEEVRECSVSAVRDGAFNEGAAVGCGEGGCFETGRLWNYVWTRDTAYAVDLGLAALDPVRARNSLEFKLSERRGGGDLQIVQDTGTGGSYPISSDRVSWALGAARLLRHLEGAERDAFAARAFEAVRNTLEHDRRVVYDPSDGLYRGEQSFLDWREQTYPQYTAGDVVHIGMSKALGTNLLHLHAMELATQLADERGETDARERYRGWADALRAAIRERFWIEEEGLFSTYVPTTLDPAPVRRYDLLASSFAVLFGVASEAQAERILASYPHYGPGAPVVWPQQQQVPVYHNRGEWPFVTAYWLRAARRADNPAVAARMTRALVRGAALNLSNMENFEAASGLPWVDEGPSSGPVVNSQRQLWSVAAYVSMVHQSLFGLEPTAEGLRVAPYVPAALADALFANTDALVLNDYPYRGRRVTVRLHLPADRGVGALTIERARLRGGEEVTVGAEGALFADAALGAASVLDIHLGPGAGDAGALTERSAADWRAIFGPRTPAVAVREEAGRLRLTLTTSEAADVTWRIYRDGEVVADGLPGDTAEWTDPTFDPSSPRSPCYTAELTNAHGNHSQHAAPACWWGPGAARIVAVGAESMTAVGGAPSTAHGRFHHQAWGDPGDRLTLPSFTATQSGPHLLQVTFGNGAGSVTTGITCALKRLLVEEVATGTIVAQGPLLMPHLGTWSRWEDSSFVAAELVAGTEYRVVIRTDDEMVNMSAFAHFEAYTGGVGGRGGEFNRANIAELKILAR